MTRLLRAAYQVKSIDWRVRRAMRVDRLNDETIGKTLALLGALL